MQYTPPSKDEYRPSHKGTKKALLSWGVIFLTALFITLSSSKTAHAGLVSFIHSVISGDKASAQTISPLHGALTSDSQTIALLQAATNIDPNPDNLADIAPVSDGETLVPSLAAATSTPHDLNTKISTYVVHDGDTISGVAQMFGVSINTILGANGLTSKSTLHVDQTLIILPVSGATYTVKKGDTIQGIASKYTSTNVNDMVDDILVYNDLTSSSSLVVGQDLIIPGADDAPRASASPSSGSRKITSAPYEPLLDDVSKLPSYPGYYARPISGGRLSQGLHGHNAVDLAAPIGTPIHAAAAGTVIISRTGGWNGGYGNYVVISHPNGTQTLYAHMLKTAVSVGHAVSQGDTIGYIGLTGLTTGPHVHFEVRGARNPFQ